MTLETPSGIYPVGDGLRRRSIATDDWIYLDGTALFYKNEELVFFDVASPPGKQSKHDLFLRAKGEWPPGEDCLFQDISKNSLCVPCGC